MSKTAENLKPFTLASDMKPAKYSEWKERLKAYFDCTGLPSERTSIQQIQFFTLIDTNLAAQIRPISGNRPVFDEDIDDCLDLLDDIFLVKWPLLRRRWAWLQEGDQRAGESITD